MRGGRDPYLLDRGNTTIPDVPFPLCRPDLIVARLTENPRSFQFEVSFASDSLSVLGCHGVLIPPPVERQEFGNGGWSREGGVL